MATRVRTVVSWTNANGRACINATPETWCFCGHRFKVHAKDNGYRCTVPGCECRCYDLQVAQGAWQVRCRCKHSNTDHACGQPRRPCTKLVGGKPCVCAAFDSPYVCTCDQSWADHRTVFREVELPMLTAMDDGLTAAEAHAIAEMAVLPTAASVALTLNDVKRGRELWEADGPVSAPALGVSASAQQHLHACVPAGALAALKRRSSKPARAVEPPLAPPPLELGSLRVGQAVQAQFSNGEWYRATVKRVLSIEPPGRVAVTFDDDGFVDDKLTATQLRALT